MKHRFVLMLFCLSIVLIFTSGCATLTTGRYQKVPVDSNPQGANVTVSSGYHDVTPCSFDLQRNQCHIIKISKEGYKTSEVTLKQTICGSTAGNAIIGGLIGLGIDTMSGACFKLIPEKVFVNLEPLDQKGQEETVPIEPPTEAEETETTEQSAPPQTNLTPETNSAL